ncbi:MAG TPA: fatty acid desaturase [Roseiflexaceae bacterium]|nr:fatty acid desaturase [Roseiflexaceae bacterium]
MPPSETSTGAAARPLRTVVVPYQRSELRRSLWQVANTLIPYGLVLYLMYLSLSYSYALTLLLAVLAGGLLVRTFIILHDCGHGSFFASKRANDILGSICGVLTFTPYFQWRHDHAVHHATTGDLDRRGVGDVHTLTVAEYMALSPREQWKYRVFRHPVSLLIFGPAWSFVINQRFSSPHSRRRERLSVQGTNLALLAIMAIAWFTIGIQAYLLIQVPVVLIAGTAAIWLFYCQHQFEETYWERHEEWDFETAAIKGSSYFKLPRVLQWFTGNIGFHHVHHLSPRVPNYNLEICHLSDPRFQEATTLTIASSWDCFRLKLWDEQRRELMPWREAVAEARLAQQKQAAEVRLEA